MATLLRASVVLIALATCGPISLPAQAATSASDSFLPAVHIIGATGVFRTDVSVFNPDTDVTADVAFYYTPAGLDGNLPGNTISFRLTDGLPPRNSITLQDIVAVYMLLDPSYGLLQVSGVNKPVIVTSNTYNVNGAVPGTYGQFSPGQPFQSSLGFDNSVFGDLYVTGVPNDANHRTNAVIMNPTGVSLEAGVQLVDKYRQIWASAVYIVPPYSLRQINDVFRKEFAASGVSPDDSYRINFFVNLNNGARILSYASITDVRTGDPYLVPGVPVPLAGAAAAAPMRPATSR
jgi:hypothetical protein